MQIIDSTGTKTGAKVDVGNRLFTNALTVEEQSEAAGNGESFNINTGDITLTSATESSVLYLKNNETRDLIISNIIYLFGASTGGSGDIVVTVVKNPTAGTVISDETAVDINSNKNFGSSITLAADVYKGAEAKTLTGGTDAFSSRIQDGKFPYVIGTGDVVLPKGSSIGFQVTPQTGNTSMILQIALAVHLRPTS